MFNVQAELKFEKLTTMTTNDKKTVYICVGYTNMYYIKMLIEHVKNFIKSYDYKIVNNVREANLTIDVYMIEKEGKLQIVYNINGMIDKPISKTYEIEK